MNTIIPIDIYNTDIMVHFGDLGSLKEELVARFGLEDALPILDGLDINDNLLGRTVLLSQGNIILWMPSVPQTAKEKGTMAHEIFHAACEIMTKIDVQPCEENEEVYAYLIGYITSRVLEEVSLLSLTKEEK
jgi:hypothetical protein